MLLQIPPFRHGRRGFLRVDRPRRDALKSAGCGTGQNTGRAQGGAIGPSRRARWVTSSAIRAMFCGRAARAAGATGRWTSPRSPSASGATSRSIVSSPCSAARAVAAGAGSRSAPRPTPSPRTRTRAHFRPRGAERRGQFRKKVRTIFGRRARLEDAGVRVRKGAKPRDAVSQRVRSGRGPRTDFVTTPDS